ncbi:MAG: MarR family winged helix-turn-helix transcriptional regulator [Alphaproteobacteria bacterium]
MFSRTISILFSLAEKSLQTQTQLCEDVLIERATMANTLKRRERDGLILRCRDVHDRRQSFITLTPKSRQLLSKLVAAAREINNTAVKGINQAEAQKLLQYLPCLKRNPNLYLS